MTTPDTPQPTPDPGASPPPAEPSHEAHERKAISQSEPQPPPQPASPVHAHAHDDEEGPQPGNAAPPPPGDEEEDEGPAPGNERFPDARAKQGPPGGTPGQPGTGKKRRRRRKKGGAGAHAQGQPGGTPGAAPAPGEGAATEGAATEGAPADKAGEATRLRSPQVREAEQPRKKPKKDRPPRPDRERPAFNVGDVVFGKIVEITDDALFVDLSGKGRAIFDRKETELPDELPEPTPEEKAAEAAAHAADAAAETHEAEATAHEGEAPAEPEAEPAVEAEAKPVEAGEEKPADAAAPEQAPAVEGDQAATAPVAEGEQAAPQPEGTQPEAAQAEAGEAPKAEAPKKEKEPPAPLPPLVLEVGAHFVGVVHNDGGRGGLVVLTRHPRRISKAKAMASQAMKDHAIVHGLVTGTIKGGLEVDVDGLRAFAPGSHVDLRKGADLSPLVGKRLDFYVTQYGKRGRDVVLSRKPMIEAEAKQSREEAIKRLHVGAVVEGIVRSVVPFGAFIDIGGIEGLVPLPEMSHNRSDGPSDVFKPGEKTQVKIMKIDDKGKVSLSRKQAMPDPWMEVAKKYAVGTKHTGKVVRVQPFGAFVELENGIDGLIHTADLSLKRIEHPNEVVKVGDSIDVVVAHVETSTHKIGLHPALQGEQANEQHQRVQVHKMVKAAVVSAETGGLLVRILGATGRSARGFVPAPMTGTPRGSDLRKLFPVGSTVEGKVIDFDARRGEVKISIKALSEDTERSAYHQYKQQVNKEARFTLGDLVKKHQEK